MGVLIAIDIQNIREGCKYRVYEIRRGFFFLGLCIWVFFLSIQGDEDDGDLSGG